MRFFLKDFQPNLEVFAKFEIFILLVWLNFLKDLQPNFEVIAKFEIFILFVDS